MWNFSKVYACSQKKITGTYNVYLSGKNVIGVKDFEI